MIKQSRGGRIAHVDRPESAFSIRHEQHIIFKRDPLRQNGVERANDLHIARLIDRYDSDAAGADRHIREAAHNIEARDLFRHLNRVDDCWAERVCKLDREQASITSGVREARLALDFCDAVRGERRDHACSLRVANVDDLETARFVRDERDPVADSHIICVVGRIDQSEHLWTEGVQG